MRTQTEGSVVTAVTKREFQTHETIILSFAYIKENTNMEKALFDWPIVLQYDVKAKYRLISRKF